MITIKHGSIFDVKTSAIVNPANVSLLAGSGLCGLIHKKAGKDLETHCIPFPRCQIGDVVTTPAFKLGSFSHIIHACGPRWLDGKRGEDEALSRLYQKLFTTCLNQKINSIAIPPISTGIYRFPIKQATDIALNEAIKVQHDDLEITFVNRELNKHLIYQKLYALKMANEDQ